MIIKKGYGFLALTITFVIGVITTLIFENVLKIYSGYGSGVGALISAVVIWIIGKKNNSLYEKRNIVCNAKNRVAISKSNDSLFSPKKEYWAFIIGLVGLFNLLNLIIFKEF